jgi:hypothetical protein
MATPGLPRRRGVHLAALLTTTAMVAVGVITAICTAAPTRAATGTLDVTFQGSGEDNPFIPTNLGGQRLEWNGDADCQSVDMPAGATGFSAANYTDQAIAVYGGADCRGTLLSYIGPRQTSLGGFNEAFSFKPNA